jgi:hypothetical protein
LFSVGPYELPFELSSATSNIGSNKSMGTLLGVMNIHPTGPHPPVLVGNIEVPRSVLVGFVSSCGLFQQSRSPPDTHKFAPLSRYGSHRVRGAVPPR